MVKYSQLTAEIYKPKEIASMIGVTTKTLRDWDDKENFFERTPDGNSKSSMKNKYY